MLIKWNKIRYLFSKIQKISKKLFIQLSFLNFQDSHFVEHIF